MNKYIQDINDWTHKSVKIKDIRKNDKMYILLLEVDGKEKIDTPVTVHSTIFNEQLTSYFMCGVDNLRREDIIGVTWNMVLTKGYFIKIKDRNLIEVKQENTNPDKWYVSYLKVSGELSTFDTICRN